jgi:galactose mutarotase-like enzyme
MGSSPPSGEQLEIRFGEQVVVVTEVGATLRSYTVGGVDVVDGFGIDEQASAGRGQVLAPWPNRLDGGRYAFGGVEGQAALDEPERGNAIHGLVRWIPWSVGSRTEGAVTFTSVLHPQPAYPWRLELDVDYRLTGDGLVVVARASNSWIVAAPLGVGFHPYLSVGQPLDAARLTLPAWRRLATDERALPVGGQEVAGTEYDFRTARELGSTQLDTCFTGLVRGEDGRVRIRVEAGDRCVELWADEAFDYVQAYTGDTLEPASRRRRAIAIEPMTCPPNAFATGTGVIALAPGATWSGTWGIAPRIST